MASPQSEKGHIDIANEFAEALARIRISGEEWQVLWVILRKTWGWKKKMDAISLSQFEQFTGLKKPTVCRAIKKLLAKCIIKKDNDPIIKNDNALASYGIQKDYEEWQPLPKKKAIIKKDNGGVDKNDTHKRNNSPSPPPPTPSLQKKSMADPRLNKFLDWWCKIYHQFKKKPYKVASGKDPKLLQSLFAFFDSQFGEEQSLQILQQSSRKFFASKDKWCEEKGYTIGNFFASINSYIPETSPSPKTIKKPSLPPATREEVLSHLSEIKTHINQGPQKVGDIIKEIKPGEEKPP